MKRDKKSFYHSCIPALLLLSASVVVSYTAPVSPNEAIQIADLWYAMELNSGYLDITEQEKADKFAHMGNRTVQYMVSKDELLDVYPTNQHVLAYIVQYTPNGFVVVSGDDRMEPVMVFNAKNEFRWENPEENFLRYYLGNAITAFWQNMPPSTHENWIQLRNKLPEDKSNVHFNDQGRDLYVFWSTSPWDQGGYYNDTVQVYNGGAGVNVPTGCTATAMAIQMKFHGWPPTGASSHSYDDVWGSVQYSHSVDFSTQTYDWDAMPFGQVTNPNSEVARLMYHAGVAVDMNYEYGESGAWPSASAMNTYFRYRGTLAYTANHDVPIQTSIIGMLPVVISSTSHTVLVTGYRDNVAPYYFLNCGWSGAGNGWYYLDSIPSSDPTIDRSYPYSQPGDYVYANDAWSGSEYGLILQPFNTLNEGQAYMPAGGELMIRSGFYTGTGNVPINFNKEGNIRAYAGDVWIGDNVYIRNYDAIRIHDDGVVKVTP